MILPIQWIYDKILLMQTPIPCFFFLFSFFFSKWIYVVASSPDNKSKVENIVETRINEHEPNINSSIDEKSVDFTQGNPFLSTTKPLAAQQTPELNGLISSKLHTKHP